MNEMSFFENMQSQIHQYKYTNTNIQTQINKYTNTQIHQYKYTNTQSAVQAAVSLISLYCRSHCSIQLSPLVKMLFYSKANLKTSNSTYCRFCTKLCKIFLPNVGTTSILGTPGFTNLDEFLENFRRGGGGHF